MERVPPKKYGGTERVVHALCDELVRRGYGVTLFASGDSKTSAKLRSVCSKSLREMDAENMYGANNLSLLNISEAYSLQDTFDIIHDHTGSLSLPTANLSSTPVVMTLHGALSPSDKRLFAKCSNVGFVSISKSQVKNAPKINLAGTVYNGLDLQNFPYSAKDEGYLLFVGRISREKGVHTAIDVSDFLKIPLLVAAKLDQIDLPYFRKKVEPRLKRSKFAKWIGEVGEKKRNMLMSKAFCFLHPVSWEEPFGLTMIESMACGCPVVAFDHGSIPEVIDSGKTGFVVSTFEEMVGAIKKIDKIKRKKCREYVLSRFNVKNMADGYEKVYKKVIEEKARAETRNFAFAKKSLIFPNPAKSF